jgi:hypothetical protein
MTNQCGDFVRPLSLFCQALCRDGRRCDNEGSEIAITRMLQKAADFRTKAPGVTPPHFYGEPLPTRSSGVLRLSVRAKTLMSNRQHLLCASMVIRNIHGRVRGRKKARMTAVRVAAAHIPKALRNVPELSAIKPAITGPKIWPIPK